VQLRSVRQDCPRTGVGDSCGVAIDGLSHGQNDEERMVPPRFAESYGLRIAGDLAAPKSGSGEHVCRDGGACERRCDRDFSNGL
jgi:hypothetical protein